MVDALHKNPDRRMVHCEMGFFARWWRVQDDATKAGVRALLERGQLEFVNGGWSQHDEAAPSYLEMLDNTAVGQRAVLDAFGSSALPRVTWQIGEGGGALAGLPTGDCVPAADWRACRATAQLCASRRHGGARWGCWHVLISLPRSSPQTPMGTPPSRACSPHPRAALAACFGLA
jgi:hypothetical protein